jgi:hypothetical protein
MIEDWWSPDGRENAKFVQAHHSEAFSALAELDALGNRILSRLLSQGTIARLDVLVGTTLLRRAVTQFVGIRHLMWASAVDPAKLLDRALFETLLATRYLVHGARRNLELRTPSNPRNREIRARYFVVGSIRDEIYQRQAMLDRVWNHSRIPADTRQGIQDEIDSRVATLNRLFPVQHKRFGRFAFDKPTGKRYHDFMKWYSFGFRRGKIPTSIQGLAHRFDWLDTYWLLYKPFSEMNHPVNFSHDIRISESKADILHAYVPDDFDSVVHWACSWQGLILIYPWLFT